MIKGLERKIMLLKGTNSKYFDEAYFIMKDDITYCDDSEILKEAEKIIFSAEGCKRIKRADKRTSAKIALFTIAGAFIGLLCGLIIGLII